MKYHVGIDIGGTFTDAVLLDEEGVARLLKTPTTLDDPARGVNNALALAEKELGLASDSLLGEVTFFGLGTTVATNALIERKGVNTGIITTSGFRDTILIQRGMGHWAGKESDEILRFSQRSHPEPVVPRDNIETVIERINYRGEVVTPLDENDVRRAVQVLLDKGVTSFAVCLLWSFREPAHEKRVAAIIQEMAPEAYVSVSSELAPLLGEYERTATTALNAYLGPHVQRYMNNLSASLTSRGMRGSFRILDSGGGVITPEWCGETAVSILTSGPSGGVLASAKLAEQLGIDNVLTTDMGGTSFDVGMIVDGEPVIAPIQEVAGYHVLKPAIQVTAIGAGGGSIAQVVDGQLMVGPESAGSVPGPACYMRGGTLPTITDADVVLGIIDPSFFLGGTFPLDRAAAVRAIDEHVAQPLGISVEDAAAGIKKIGDHKMADLLENLTVGKGHDPRDFVVFAYGGAGGTHCHRFGTELGVRSVIVPATATVHSAFGAVMSNLHITKELADPMHCSDWANAPALLDAARIQANFELLEAQATEALIDSGAQPNRIALQRFAEIKFRMQSKSLSVPVAEGELSETDLTKMLTAFRTQFAQTYGEEAVFTDAGIEIPSFRVSAHGELPKPEITRVVSSGATNGDKAVGTRSVYLGPNEGYFEATVYRGSHLQEGDVLDGPAMFEHPGTTIFISKGQQARIDHMGNTIITNKEGQ